MPVHTRVDVAHIPQRPPLFALPNALTGDPPARASPSRDCAAPGSRTPGAGASRDVLDGPLLDVCPTERWSIRHVQSVSREGLDNVAVEACKSGITGASVECLVDHVAGGRLRVRWSNCRRS